MLPPVTARFTVLSGLRSLLVHGKESDMLSDETANIMISNLAFGSLTDIEGTGHGIPGDNPVAFEKAIGDFLKR